LLLVVEVKPPTAAPIVTPVTIAPPAQCKKTNGAAITSTSTGICRAYKDVLADFDAITSGKADVIAKAVRIAFHDAGEADITKADLMRSDGCLSPTAENAGLIEDTSVINTVLLPIWQKYCDLISLADFWVLVAQIGIKSADPTNTIFSPFKFQYGRVDASSCSEGEGRLPSAQLGVGGIRQVFVNQMGLTLDDAVILIGAHTIGHVHPTASGYGLPGDMSKDVLLNAWDEYTPTIFDNGYFNVLMEEVHLLYFRHI
jgi:hypothetical protein